MSRRCIVGQYANDENEKMNICTQLHFTRCFTNQMHYSDARAKDSAGRSIISARSWIDLHYLSLQLTNNTSSAV